MTGRKIQRRIDTPQLIYGCFNQTIRTPLGAGVAFGEYRLRDREQGQVETLLLVRLPVNDVTAPHLMDENCLTKQAGRSALFTFKVSEVEAG